MSPQSAATLASVTPISSLDIDLTRVSLNGATTAVHQLSGNITVTVNLTVAQIAQIADVSNARLYYYNTDNNTFTDMGATFNMTAGSVTFTTNHFNTYVIATTKAVITPIKPVGVQYASQVQHIGWQKFVNDGALSGTTGKSLRDEALKIKLTGDIPAGAKITYQAHVQNIGWQASVSNGATAGTIGKSLRVEALKVSLSGLAGYEVQYRAYVQNKGWLAWQTTTNGTAMSKAAIAGTTGKSLILEAIEVRIVKIGS